MEAIERLYPDRLREHVERLAHHASTGEVWEKAVSYLRQAGAKAFARSANREAIGYFEQALTALTRLPETRETLEQAIDIRFDLRNALYPLANSGGSKGISGKPKPWPGDLSDQRRLGWVSAYMCSHHWATCGHAADVRTLRGAQSRPSPRRSAMCRSRS